MLIDEAHLYPREADSMLGTFLRESGITHVLGITATPVKLQTNRDRDGCTFSKLVMLTSRSKKGNFFKDIIHVGQVQEMVEMGFWSPLKYTQNAFDSSLLVFNSSKSEYTEESVQRAYDANGGTQSVIDALDAHPSGGTYWRSFLRGRRYTALQAIPQLGRDIRGAGQARA